MPRRVTECLLTPLSPRAGARGSAGAPRATIPVFKVVFGGTAVQRRLSRPVRPVAPRSGPDFVGCRQGRALPPSLPPPPPTRRPHVRTARRNDGRARHDPASAALALGLAQHTCRGKKADEAAARGGPSKGALRGQGRGNAAIAPRHRACRTFGPGPPTWGRARRVRQGRAAGPGPRHGTAAWDRNLTCAGGRNL